MNTAQQTEGEQSTLWNGLGARGWVEVQATIDQVLLPFELLLVKAVASRGASEVLDVGCGTGGTTLALARSLGAKGHCMGIDISEPMLAAARMRAQGERTPVGFIHGDAQVHPFEAGSYDMIVSRFGVMFFNDFAQAFANLRRAARDDAELTFVAWRTPAENPFMTTAERAAGALLPDIPARQPDAPGPFAFADSSRVHGYLEQGGWTAIDIQPLDVVCTLPEPELVPYLTLMGPVGRILQEADERTRRQVIEAVRPAFDPYVQGTEVQFTAACWWISAEAGD